MNTKQKLLPFCWGLKCCLSDQKVTGDWVKFYCKIQSVSSCWLQRFYSHFACLSESLSSTEKMSSDESEFSVSYCSSGRREETATNVTSQNEIRW